MRTRTKMLFYFIHRYIFRSVEHTVISFSDPYEEPGYEIGKDGLARLSYRVRGRWYFVDL